MTDSKDTTLLVLRFLPTVFYAVLLGLFSLPLLIKGHFYIAQNIQDYFMPYTAAYAMEQGVKLHSSFHSPLGWVYHAVSYGLLALIKQSYGMLEAGSLPYLLNTFTALFVFGLLCALNTAAPRSYKISPWLISTAVSLCFALQHIFLFDYRMVTWYGLYNNHLAALLFVQTAILLQWLNINRDAAPAVATQKLFNLTCLIEGVILYVTLHYKIGAFIAAGGFTAALFLILPQERRWRFAASQALLLGCGIIFTALCGYDYQGYVGDILFAVDAQQQAGWNIGGTLLVYSSEAVLIPVCLFMLAYLLMQKKAMAGKHLSPLAYSFAVFCITAACFILARNSYFNPYVYPLCVMCFISIDTGTASARDALCKTFLGLVILTSLLSCLYTAQQKTSPTMKGDAVYATKMPFGELRFKTPAALYDATITQPLRDVFERSVYHFATPQQPTNFNAGDAILQLNENITVLQQLHITQQQHVFSIGFTNNLPMALRTQIPTPSHHWLHVGINLSVDELSHAITQTAVQSDMVVMPIASHYIHHQVMNCAFYIYNHDAQQPFYLAKVTPYSLYWVKQGNSATPLLHKQPDEVFVNKCRAFLAQPTHRKPFYTPLDNTPTSLIINNNTQGVDRAANHSTPH